MFLQNLLILLVGVSVATALVFNIFAVVNNDFDVCRFNEPTITDIKQLAYGVTVRAKNICGVLTCTKIKGYPNLRITYCQETVPFAECETDGIKTDDIPYPDCCWQCVKYKDC